jgi:hypothetical protein
MLVEVEKFAQFPWSPVLAQISTPVGRAAIRWRGDPNATTGQHHVEWDIDLSNVSASPCIPIFSDCGCALVTSANG